MTQFGHQLFVAQTCEGLLKLGLLRQGGTHLTEIPAFDQGQAVLNHFATLPQGQQRLSVHAGRHAVFATVQRLPGKIEAPIQPQPESILDHAVGFQTIEHACWRGACRNIQQLLLRHLQRLMQRFVLLPKCNAQRQACQHYACFQQDQ